MIHKLPTNKRSVLGWLCRREMRQNLKKKKELSVNPAKIDENTVHIYEEKKSRFDIFNEMVVFSVAKNFLLNCNGDAHFNWKYFCITVDVQNVLQRKHT